MIDYAERQIRNKEGEREWWCFPLHYQTEGFAYVGQTFPHESQKNANGSITFGIVLIFSETIIAIFDWNNYHRFMLCGKVKPKASSCSGTDYN